MMRHGHLAQKLRPLLGELTRFARWLAQTPQEADEVVQETLLRALRAHEDLADTRHLKAWLFRIARNAHVDLRRAQAGRDRFVLLGGGLDELSALETPPPVPPARVEGVDLERALAELPEGARAALVLTDVWEFDHEEVARILDIPVGTVKSRVARRARVWRHFSHKSVRNEAPPTRRAGGTHDVERSSPGRRAGGTEVPHAVRASPGVRLLPAATRDSRPRASELEGPRPGGRCEPAGARDAAGGVDLRPGLAPSLDGGGRRDARRGRCPGWGGPEGARAAGTALGPAPRRARARPPALRAASCSCPGGLQRLARRGGCSRRAARAPGRRPDVGGDDSDRRPLLPHPVGVGPARPLRARGTAHFVLRASECPAVEGGL
ncbi:MAG: RNA polymerase sigma factor [Myxococcales bacterium]|nr:RNA polymerase sigma factor [Myxococcales bacterium]